GARLDEHRLAPTRAARAAAGQLERFELLDPVRRVAGQVQGPGHAFEDRGPAAELPALPVGLDAAPAGERHERDLRLACRRREGAAPDAQPQVAPAPVLAPHLPPA